MAPIRSKATRKDSEFCVEKTRKVNGVTISTYHCTLCPTFIAHKSDFPRHLRTHTGEGLYFCDVDGCKHKGGFAQRSNLRTHQKAQHEGVRYVCPDLEDENGEQVRCGQLYSDQAGLIRHRKKAHGRAAGQGPKYTIIIIKKEADDGDEAVPPALPFKLAKATPALSSSGGSPKKSTPTKSAPIQVPQIDCSVLPSLPTARSSSTLSPTFTGFGCPTTIQPTNMQTQSQPGSGMTITDPLTLPQSITPPTFSELSNPEPQTATVNKWVFPPGNTFDFPSMPLPLPDIKVSRNVSTGSFDASTLMAPASIVPSTPEETNLAHAGLASQWAYEFYCHPGWGSNAPDSELDVSRESTASPGCGMLDAGMVQWTPLPSELAFNGYYGS